MKSSGAFIVVMIATFALFYLPAVFMLSFSPFWLFTIGGSTLICGLIFRAKLKPSHVLWGTLLALILMNVPQWFIALKEYQIPLGDSVMNMLRGNAMGCSILGAIIGYCILKVLNRTRKPENP